VAVRPSGFDSRPRHQILVSNFINSANGARHRLDPTVADFNCSLTLANFSLFVNGDGIDVENGMKAYLDNNVVSAIAKDDTKTESDALDRLLTAYQEGQVDLVTSEVTLDRNFTSVVVVWVQRELLTIWHGQVEGQDNMYACNHGGVGLQALCDDAETIRSVTGLF
jgi:hypothetical protein